MEEPLVIRLPEQTAGGRREVLREPAQGNGRVVRHTSCLGGYAHVVLKLVPDESLDAAVVESVDVAMMNPATIPKVYLPAMVAGIGEAVLQGGPAGYPLIGLRVRIIGGSFHPSDSHESAYTVAALRAMQDALSLRQTRMIDLMI